MKNLVVGLGNPDAEYAKSPHNAGFLFTQKLSEGDWKSGYRDLWEEQKIKGAVMIRPLTYMNKSGEAVKEAAKQHGIKPENILVIHDDLDIELGRVKMTFDRSAAMHKGVESIIKNLKTQKFWRLRVGISPKKKPLSKKMKDFLLKKMTAPQEKTMLKNSKKIGEGVEMWIEDHAKGMQFINTK